MKELSMEDLKKRLEIRGVIIGNQSDRIQELLQTIHNLEKELAEFKAIKLEQEFHVYQNGDESTSPERLLAEKKAFEDLLEQRNQELRILTAKLDGLSSLTPAELETLEELTFANLKLQERLKEADQQIKRLSQLPRSTTKGLDEEKHFEALQTQLAKERERNVTLETRLNQKEQEQKALQEFLSRKDERITALAAQVQELSGIRAQLEAERGRHTDLEQEQKHVANEAQELQGRLAKKDAEIAELASQAHKLIELQMQLKKEREHRIDLEAILHEQEQKFQKFVNETQELRDQLIKKDEKISTLATPTQEPTDVRIQLEKEQELRKDLEKVLYQQKQEHQKLINEQKMLVDGNQELRDQLIKKDEEIAALIAQVQEPSELGMDQRQVEESFLHQTRAALENLEHLKKQHEIERQKFLYEKDQLQQALEAKAHEVTNLQADLERLQHAYINTRDRLEVSVSEDTSLFAHDREPEKDAYPPPKRYAAEILKEKVIPSAGPVPSRSELQSPVIPLHPIPEAAPPGDWYQLDLQAIFEAFLTFLESNPEVKEIIFRLEVLRDILFERKGGGMVVRRCGTEIQSLNRGVRSPESLRNVLREMASSLGIYLA